MTTSALLVCQACEESFTPEDPSRRGPKPTICPDCTALYLNPPEQVESGRCRICQTPVEVPAKGWKHFCDDCYKIRVTVYNQDMKRKERAARLLEVDSTKPEPSGRSDVSEEAITHTNFERYEIHIRFRNGDEITGRFSDKARAIEFLETYR